MHQSIPGSPIQELSSVYTKPNPQMSPLTEDPPHLDPSGLKLRAHRVERWVEAQHCQEDEEQNEDGPRASSNCHPYLAYPPQLSVRSIPSEQSDYVLVHESNELTKEKVDMPDTPTKHTSGVFNATSPLRNFRFSFSPSRRPTSSSSQVAPPHNSSLSNLNIPRTPPAITVPSPRRPQSAWNVASKLRRTGVFDRSSTTAATNTPEADQSRPSFSSSGSYSTRPSLDSPSTVFSSGSSPTFKRNPSPSLWSLPSSGSHLNDPPGSTKLLSQQSRSTIRVFSLKTPGHNSSAQVSNLLSNSLSGRKKKILVISGITMGDIVRFELAKQWCESFGEVRCIVRAPNGDIHVEFRKSEVADTVCRVRAQVTIAGIGSVGLSWYAGKRS